MRAFHKVYATQGLVAFALAAGTIMSVSWALGPPNDRQPGDRGQADLAGVAKVVDGDTLAIGGARIRLEGIDAPEAGQTCPRRLLGHGACGTEATNALSRLVEGKTLRREPRGLDKYDRTLGVCFLDAMDVNAWMVRTGNAWAFVKYSTS